MRLPTIPSICFVCLLAELRLTFAGFAHCRVQPLSRNILDANLRRPTAACLVPKKPASSASEGTELNYAKIGLMLFNPLNPYSWFLYFFIGIFLYSAVSNN